MDGFALFAPEVGVYLDLFHEQVMFVLGRALALVRNYARDRRLDAGLACAATGFLADIQRLWSTLFHGRAELTRPDCIAAFGDTRPVHHM
jgi:hypothetical protein